MPSLDVEVVWGVDEPMSNVAETPTRPVPPDRNRQKLSRGPGAALSFESCAMLGEYLRFH